MGWVNFIKSEFGIRDFFDRHFAKQGVAIHINDGPREGPAGHQCILLEVLYRANIARSKRATMLIILIIGFTAGPAVSL